MPIHIKKPDPSLGAHDQEANNIETTITQTTTKAGQEQPLSQQVQHNNDSVPELLGVPAQLVERIVVGMSFKMPVASYTMLEFSISRSIPYAQNGGDPDAVFDLGKDWVESKLNDLIAEQQQQPDGE